MEYQVGWMHGSQGYVALHPEGNIAGFGATAEEAIANVQNWEGEVVQKIDGCGHPTCEVCYVLEEL